jgi:hypothetical protein
MHAIRTSILTHLSRPTEDRIIYRTIRRSKAQRILEIGLDSGERGLRMIEVASQGRDSKTVQYIGIDPFENRSLLDGPRFPIQAVYKSLSTTGAQIRLLPGRPDVAVSRLANLSSHLDLIVIATRQTEWLRTMAPLLQSLLSRQGHILLGSPRFLGGPFSFRKLEETIGRLESTPSLAQGRDASPCRAS